jgi:hypothetical protein
MHSTAQRTIPQTSVVKDVGAELATGRVREWGERQRFTSKVGDARGSPTDEPDVGSDV